MSAAETEFAPAAALTEGQARQILEAVREASPRVKIFIYERGGAAGPRISEVAVELSDDESGLVFARGGWEDLSPGSYVPFDPVAGSTIPLPLPQEGGEPRLDRLATPSTLRALYVALLEERLEKERRVNEEREKELKERIQAAWGGA